MQMSHAISHVEQFPHGLQLHTTTIGELMRLMSDYFGHVTTIGPPGKDGTFGVYWGEKHVLFSGYLIITIGDKKKYIDLNDNALTTIREKIIDDIIDNSLLNEN